MVVHLSDEIRDFVEGQTAARGFQSIDEYVEDVLREKQRVQQSQSQAEMDQWHKQLQAIERVRQELADFPSPKPGTGFSDRDHDRLIYEDRK